MQSKDKPKSKQQRQADSWFAEHGRTLLWVLGAGGAALVAALHVLGLIEEQISGALLAIVIIGVACVRSVSALSDAAPNRGLSLLALAFGIALFAVATAAALPAVVPGDPAAHAVLRKDGDALQLPASVRGPIRLLVNGRIAGSEAGTASVDLDVGKQHLTAEISRSFARARVGRGGSTQVVNEHDAEYLEAEAGPDAASVTLSAIHGQLRGPVEVSVYTDLLPLRWELVLACVLLVLGAWISASWGARSAGVNALTVALLFGILVHRMATPTEAVGAEFGALLISLFCAVFISTIVLTVLERLVAARRAA